MVDPAVTLHQAGTTPDPADAVGSLADRMRFRGRWRDYQQRVLDDLDALLADERLHVVAAPGSGKTVLGLEITRRLGRPAIILSPTRTIRDQWSARLEELFLEQPAAPGSISDQLDELGDLTAVTYQALHAHWAGEKSRFDDLAARIRALGPVTLILDEAHHLRREWWSALQALAETLPNKHIVALTATPPYDAPFSEWARYEAMCGPVDLEIGIPELVRNGDLCPHQDHIIFSEPGADALDLLDRRRERISTLQADLRSDEDLLYRLEMHPWLQDPDAHVEQILETPEMLSAILVLLASAGRRPPPKPMQLLGIAPDEIQLPSAFWTEILLEGLLIGFPDLFPIPEERADTLRGLLHECGLIEGGHVRLRESRSIFTMMAGSLAKLDSIAEIARQEAANLGDKLRMVVLSDHIRSGEISRVAAADYRPTKLGVVPIFETLRRAAIGGQQIGVLTGTVVVLPVEAVKRLREVAGPDYASLQLRQLEPWPQHVLVDDQGDSHRLVELITQIFCEGGINMLVGTQSLLGEGWDAPAINSLVLASNSAAFMLSNQMRGRAIRIDPRDPGKVANIWHLATVDPSMFEAFDLDNELNWGSLDDGAAACADFALLQRRFKAFEGIPNGGSLRIEGGLARLGWFNSILPSNDRTFAFAKDRAAIADTWTRSLGGAAPRAHVREIASPTYAPRGLAWFDTLRWLGISAASAASFAAGNQLRFLKSTQQLAPVAMAVAAAATIASLPLLVRALWLTLRNGSLESSVYQVAQTVLVSSHRSGLISDEEFENAGVEVYKSLSGVCDVFVTGVTRATEHAMICAIAEILGPVQNPRYLLLRQSWFGPLRRTDYHAVPAALGSRKESAEIFHREWKAHVGSSHLVFTRTRLGRLVLLRARSRSFAAGFRRAVDRRSAWL